VIDQPPTRKNEPIYRPPYESPIEDDFAYNAVKYLRKEVKLVPQQRMRTYCGTFRVDFLIESGKRRVAVECDGKAFHRTARDLARDTLILGSYAVDTIFRLQGSNIYYRIGDCLFLLSRYAPELFTDRGLANLETLAAPETRAQANVWANPFVSVEHCVIDNEERGIFHDPDDVPWTVLFRAHSLRLTNFYHYMFKEFWDIVRYKKLNSLVAVQNMLGDPITLIDEHFAWLDTLGIIGRRNYEVTIETRQRELYPPSRR
jgi:hypothetical protein